MYKNNKQTKQDSRHPGPGLIMTVCTGSYCMSAETVTVNIASELAWIFLQRVTSPDSYWSLVSAGTLFGG
jgi:hypothetical protein